MPSRKKKTSKALVRKTAAPPRWIVPVLLLALAAALVFWHLGRPCLWVDEAQTAVVAQNIVAQGIPAASDGRNLVSIFQDHRDIRDGVYIWQGWLPTYLAAGSIALGGRNAFSARLPFAAAFVVFVGVFYGFLRKWDGARTHRLWLTMALTLTCVPLLLHARQCRYYVLAPLLNLLIVDAYLSWWKEPKWKHQVLLLVWATALINSFFPGAFLLGIALAVDLIRRKSSARVWRTFALTAGAILLINLPMAWFCRIWDRQFSVESGYDSPAIFGLYLLRYLLTLNNFFFPLTLILLALALRWKAITRANIFRNDLTFLFLTICGTQIVGFALLADFPFTRYLIGVVPFLMFFGATCLETLGFGRAWLSWSLALLVAGTNLFHILPLPLLRLTSLQAVRWTRAGINPEFLGRGQIGVGFARGELKELAQFSAGFPFASWLRSVADPPRGPIDELVEYLAQHAAPTDRVKISYGDLPLMFHTELEVVSSSEVGKPAPEWMVFRHFGAMEMDEKFVRETAKVPYSKVPLPFPDLQWNNQPDPLYHYYETPPNDLAPPVALLKKG